MTIVGIDLGTTYSLVSVWKDGEPRIIENVLGERLTPSVVGLDDDGQILEAHSISAGLDYPGIGPEHSWLHDVGRVEYVSATDAEALEAFQLCSRMEGIIPALEPSHALAHVSRIAPELPKDHIMVMNMCGRGDKDVFTVADALGVTL